MSSAVVRAAQQGEAGRVDDAILASSLTDLQRTAGNTASAELVGGVTRQRAVAGGEHQGVLQRAPLTPAEKAKNLTSARYAGDPALEAAYDNSPPLKRGSRKGKAVTKVQQGLVDAGLPMPISTKSGAPDGIFGRETKATVTAFQAKHGLGPDGIVGRQTMGKLDELARGAGPQPVKPARPPEIAATEEEMGKHVAEGMTRANVGHSPTSGIWYDHNYFAEHQADPSTYPWDEDWRNGLANEDYFERIATWDWRLKPGKSASEGIRAWLKGLTIAECFTAILAIQIDTIRAAIGDDAFDARFGSEDTVVPEARRLRVRQAIEGTPVEGMLKDAEAATGDAGPKGHRNLKVGDWVYLYNHPKYLLKHPGGAWQGENAVYVGDNAKGVQLFSGLGASDMTEEAMLAEMAAVYNHSREADDYVALLNAYASDTPEVKAPDPRYAARDAAYVRKLYEKYEGRIPSHYREDSGEFEDKVSVDDILNDPEYTIPHTTTSRKGGFIPSSASRHDAAKVSGLRPAP